MKIAQFLNVEHNFVTIDYDVLDDLKGYVRISEYIDVEFPDRPREEVVTQQVAALKDEKKKVQAETERKINDIDDRIDDLLALPQLEE